VLSLRPSLVIAITSAGPPDSLRLLREAGVRIEVTPEDWTPEGVVARIRQVGRLAGAEAAADRLGAAVAARFSELAAARAQIARPQRVLFVLTLQNGRPMVGGRNSAADAIIRLAGGINAADAVEGYKPMTDEAVIGAAPDVVLTMARGSHALTADDIFALPAFRLTPAAARRRLVTMDGLLLLGFGPRTPEAGFELMSAVHGPLATGAIR
jgi:iron complex transport system substrate-binding protein